MTLCRSSPISSSGILSSLLMMLVTLRLRRLELTRNGRQLHWLLRPIHRRRGRAGEKVERHDTRLRSAGSPSAVARGPRGPPRNRSTFCAWSRNPRRDFKPTTLTPSLCGVQVDGHRHRELEGLQVDLCANVRDLADRNAAELDRRAGRQPSDRFIEDELDRSADCARPA